LSVGDYQVADVIPPDDEVNFIHKDPLAGLAPFHH
jgi:hypothetical protein